MRSLHDLKAPPSRVTERLANSSPAEGKEDELLQPPASEAGRKQSLREATAELTNILSGVSSHCNALFFRFGLDQPMRQELLTLQNAVARAAQLARELEALGDRKSGRGEDTVLNLNDLIADHARAIQSLIGEDIYLTTQLAPEVPAVRMCSKEILQIVFNLAAHCHDAMPKGGQLMIATYCERMSKDSRAKAAGRRTNDMTAPTCVAGYRREVSPSLPAASAPLLENALVVSLRFQDTSKASVEQLQRRLHKPFFAARPNGIGVTTAAEVAKEMGACISVVESANQEAAIVLHLPKEHCIN